MSEDDPKSDPRLGALPVTAERRVVRRHSCVLRVTCHLVSGETTETWTAAVRDISETGIGIVHGKAMEIGGFLVLEVPFPKDNFDRSLGASVIHCTQRDEGGFAIGCAFDQRLSENDLQSLLDENLLDL